MTDAINSAGSSSKKQYSAGTDLSGQNLDGADLSGLHLDRLVMRDCSLCGANLRNTIFQSCDLTGSNWDGADFRGAKFYGGIYTSIKNVPRAKNLDTVFAGNYTCEFFNPELNTADKLDWEKIKVIGRLPFFGISTAAIVMMSIYYYILEIYNTRVDAAQKALEAIQDQTIVIVVMHGIADHLKIPVPNLAFTSICAAIFLLCASILYALFCPDRVKQFSSEAWLYQLQKSLIEYRPYTWKFAAIRWVCAFLYLFGGGMSAYVIIIKLFLVMKFVLSSA